MWPEELLSVLWAYYTTMRIPTSETPFSLAFETEVVVQVEIGIATHRTENFDPKANEKGLRNNLNLLEEKRDKVALQVAVYKQKITKYYNSRVKARRFTVGDLVLRKVTHATQDPTEGKLKPNWERSYQVTQCNRLGTYHLEIMRWEPLPPPWNVEHLKNILSMKFKLRYCLSKCFKLCRVDSGHDDDPTNT